jgi:lysophospholipase L1-like esterase
MLHVLLLAFGTLAGMAVMFLAARAASALFAIHYCDPVPPAPPGTVRIACIGDSITYGLLVKRRRRNCYPVQLEQLLGTGFSVRNFGANGRAVQKASDMPYWRHKYFELSSTFEPDIVLIMLGTNDSRKPNWKGLEPYMRDYRALLAHYRGLPSKPVVYALTPPTEFRLRNQRRVRYGMIQHSIDEMTRGIKQIALEIGVPVIDINAATAAHPEHFSFDGVHANLAGATHIAHTIYAAIGRPIPATVAVANVLESA